MSKNKNEAFSCVLIDAMLLVSANKKLVQAHALTKPP